MSQHRNGSPPPRQRRGAGGVLKVLFLPAILPSIRRASHDNWRLLDVLAAGLPAATGLTGAVKASLRGALKDIKDPAPASRAQKPLAALRLILALAAIALAVHAVSSAAGAVIAPALAVSSPAPLSGFDALSAAPDALTGRLWAGLESLKTHDTALSKLITALNLFFCAIFAVVLLSKFLVIPADAAARGRLNLSKYWILRLALALALIVPAPSSALNGGQTGVLALARWGGALGARAWRLFAAGRIEDDPPLVLPPPPDRFRSAVLTLILDETCMYLANAVAERGGDPPYVRFSGAAGDEDGMRVEAGYDGAPPSLPRRLCGGYALTVGPPDTADTAPLRAAMFAADPGAFDAARAALAAHARAFNAALKPIHALARAIGGHFLPGAPTYGAPLPPVDETLADSGVWKTYADTLVRGFAHAKDRAGRERGRAVDPRDGWMAAGTWALRQSRSARTLSAAYAAFPTVDPPAPPAFDISDVVAAGLQQTEAWLAASRFDPNSRGWLSALKRGRLTIDDLIVFDGLGPPDLSSNPLEALVAYGQSIINWWEHAVGYVTGASMAVGAARALPFVGEGAAGALNAAWTVIGPFYTGLMTALLLAAATLSYALPFLPAALFVVGIALWMQAGLIAFIGVDLLAIAMLDHREPKPMTAQMTAAALLILRFVAWPALMVLGLAFALLLIDAVLSVHAALFRELIPGPAESGSISQVAWVVLFTLLAYTIANMGFRLILRFPIEVFSLIEGKANLFSDDSEIARSAAAAARPPGLGKPSFHPRPGSIRKRGPGGKMSKE